MRELKTRVLMQESHPFYHCCLEAANEVCMCESLLNDLMKKTEGREMTDEEENDSFALQHQLHMSEVSSPIFGVTAAEAFIYNYASFALLKRHKYSIEHIDKLDTYSKWIVIPALCSGSEINKDSSAMNDFNQLIKVRNAIIHPKPHIVNNFTEQQLLRAGDKIENQSIERRIMSKKAPSIFVNLVKELAKVDKSAALSQLIVDMGLPTTEIIVQ